MRSLIVGFVVALVSVLGMRHADPERPMPCKEDEIYVWDDAPVSAHCVNQDEYDAQVVLRWTEENSRD